VLRRAVLELTGATMQARQLPAHVRGRAFGSPPSLRTSPPPAGPRGSPPQRRSRAVRRGEMQQVLCLHGGNVRRASGELGVSRAHFYRLLTRWELDPTQYRPAGRAAAQGEIEHVAQRLAARDGDAGRDARPPTSR
jgi:DNA-binding NtrC family response regulator